MRDVTIWRVRAVSEVADGLAYMGHQSEDSMDVAACLVAYLEDNAVSFRLLLAATEVAPKEAK